MARNTQNGYWTGAKLLTRIEHVSRDNAGLGSRVMHVKARTGEYTVKQLDRDCFVIDGPFYTGPCDGWIDALTLIDSI